MEPSTKRGNEERKIEARKKKTDVILRDLEVEQKQLMAYVEAHENGEPLLLHGTMQIDEGKSSTCVPKLASERAATGGVGETETTEALAGRHGEGTENKVALTAQSQQKPSLFEISVQVTEQNGAESKRDLLGVSVVPPRSLFGVKPF